MGSSSGQQQTTQTQTSDPWSGAQPHLQNLMQSAEEMYNNNTGYQPYTGDPQAAVNTSLSDAQMAEYNMGAAEPWGSSGVNAARAYGEGLINSGGMTADTTKLAGQYGDIYSQNAGEENPYLLEQIAANDRRIGDKVNSSMSGAGRYGSGAHTDVMSRSLAEAANPILAQDYTQRQNTMLNALQGQQGVYSNAQNLAGQWAQNMPGLDEARYAGSGHMQNIGNYYQNRDQQAKANELQLYNAQQAYPWEQLSRYQSAVSGTGALGGTKVTSTTPYQQSTLQKIAGGALSGAGLGGSFGGAGGAAAGALGGGLLSLL
jgi:hypothetical protein